MTSRFNSTPHCNSTTPQLTPLFNLNKSEVYDAEFNEFNEIILNFLNHFLRVIVWRDSWTNHIILFWRIHLVNSQINWKRHQILKKQLASAECKHWKKEFCAFFLVSSNICISERKFIIFKQHVEDSRSFC